MSARFLTLVLIALLAAPVGAQPSDTHILEGSDEAGGIRLGSKVKAYPELRPIPEVHEGIYGLIANVPVLVVVSLMTAPPCAERVRAYVEA